VVETKGAKPSSPPSASESNQLLLGKFGAAQGLKGEIRLQSYTADPFAIGSYGALTSNDGRKFEITHLRSGKNILIARVKNITDRTAAEQLTNLALYIDRALLGKTQEEDEYFHADLVGLNVETSDGTHLGKVLALFNFGAGDMLEIRPVEGGKSVMLPFTKLAVPYISLTEKRIIVDFSSFESAMDDKPDPLDQIN
jgi:16S rRNA processing protein RimM